MYLLDTSIVSALRRPERMPAPVAQWFRGAVTSELFISVITITELETGARLMQRRDAAQGNLIMRWLEGQVMQGFRGRILPVDLNVARLCTMLHVPNPRPARDALIGATALAHRLRLVTRNVSDFGGMDVPLIDPWEGSPA